jgi:transcription antitermination factor NusG
MHNLQGSELLWYAIRVRSRFERVVSAALAGKGYEEYLPLYRRHRNDSPNSQVYDLPLFPGYVFCRVDITDRLLSLFTTPGVVSMVGAGKTPIPIPVEQIEFIKTVLKSGLAAEPWPHIALGTRIVIEKGPLAGIQGITIDVDRRHRLIVSIPLLQRSVSVEIDREWARPLYPPAIRLAV